MVERSRFWNGTSVGDANEAPYDGPTEFGRILDSILGASAPTGYGAENNHGIFPYNDAPSTAADGVLLVSGAASPVTIGGGRAWVRGSWYENDAPTTVVIPTPAGATRIDLIVLRKDWAAQTVRITRIAGVEGGAAPATTRTDGLTWDIILGQVTITTGGVITLSHFDRRYMPRHNASKPIVSVSHSALVAVGIGATVVQPWNTTFVHSFPPSGLLHNVAVNNTRLYAAYNGIYRVNATVKISQINDNGLIELAIGKNMAGVAPFGAANILAEGNFKSMLVAGQSITNQYVSIPPTQIVLAQGDYIELSIENGTDAAVDSQSAQAAGYSQGYFYPRLELELLYGS